MEGGQWRALAKVASAIRLCPHAWPIPGSASYSQQIATAGPEKTHDAAMSRQKTPTSVDRGSFTGLAAWDVQRGLERRRDAAVPALDLDPTLPTARNCERLGSRSESAHEQSKPQGWMRKECGRGCEKNVGVEAAAAEEARGVGVVVDCRGTWAPCVVVGS